MSQDERDKVWAAGVSPGVKCAGRRRGLRGRGCCGAVVCCCAGAGVWGLAGSVLSCSEKGSGSGGTAGSSLRAQGSPPPLALVCVPVSCCSLPVPQRGLRSLRRSEGFARSQCPAACRGRMALGSVPGAMVGCRCPEPTGPSPCSGGERDCAL